MPAPLDPSGTLSNPQTYIYFTDRTQNEDLRSHWWWEAMIKHTQKSTSDESSILCCHFRLVLCMRQCVTHEPVCRNEYRTSLDVVRTSIGCRQGNAHNKSSTVFLYGSSSPCIWSCPFISSWLLVHYIKGIVKPKMTIISSYTDPCVFPNPYDDTIHKHTVYTHTKIKKFWRLLSMLCMTLKNVVPLRGKKFILRSVRWKVFVYIFFYFFEETKMVLCN